MADLFLVLFLYALMLAVGPTMALLMGRRANQLTREKKAALEEHLGQDPTVLIGARPDGGISFTTVKDGVDLHVDEMALTSALRSLRAHAHGVELGRRTPLYVGIPAGANRRQGERLTPLGQQIFGPRVEVRAGDLELAATLLEVEQVREAIRDLFRGPLFGLGVELDCDGALTVDVRLDYAPEVMETLLARARRLVEVLGAHARIEAQRTLPEAAARGALAGPSGNAIGVTPFREGQEKGAEL